MSISYPQLQEAAAKGPEAVAAMLYAAGVELSGLPKDLRRQLRGEPPAKPAEANAGALDTLAGAKPKK